MTLNMDFVKSNDVIVISFAGSFYDNCISRDGKVYKKDHGEFGCYHFHSNNLGRGGKVYNYDTSQEFCRNLNGTLPVIRSKEEDTSMLKLLNGYVSIIVQNKNNLITLIFEIGDLRCTNYCISY